MDGWWLERKAAGNSFVRALLLPKIWMNFGSANYIFEQKYRFMKWNLLYKDWADKDQVLKACMKVNAMQDFLDFFTFKECCAIFFFQTSNVILPLRMIKQILEWYHDHALLAFFYVSMKHNKNAVVF